MTSSQSKSDQEKKQKKYLFFLLLLILFLIIGGFLFFKSQEPPVYDQRAVTYRAKVSRPTLRATEAAFPGFSNITLTKPAKVISMAFANPKFNSVDLKFTVTETEPHKKVLLKTKLIKPGQAILSMPTPNSGRPGYYTLVIQSQAFNKQHRPLNLFRQKILLTIE